MHFASLAHSFFAELQRRHVYKVGATYAVAAWLLAQVVTQLLPVYGVSTAAQQLIITSLVIGFPLSLVVAWVFEGATNPADHATVAHNETSGAVARPLPSHSSRRLNIVLSLLLIFAAGEWVFEHYVLSRNDLAVEDKSIAVMPFENLSNDPNNAFLSQGIQDEILTRLSQIGDLRVISRSSTQQYASHPANLSSIAHELKVATILEGSTEQQGGKVRINVQLIRAADDSHIWSEIYDRPADDILGVQGEVALAIANALNARLNDKEGRSVGAHATSNAEAYDAFLRGVAANEQGKGAAASVLGAIAEFQQAVKLDPNFALAWARLSREESFAYFTVESSRAHWDAASQALDRARDLDPNLIDTRLADGLFRFWVERDDIAAQIRFEAITKVTPNSPLPWTALAFIARRRGNWVDAGRLFEEASKRSPNDIDLIDDMADTAIALRDWPAALKFADHMQEVSPGNVTATYVRLRVAQSRGDLATAKSLTQSVLDQPFDLSAMQIVAREVRMTRTFETGISLIEEGILHAANRSPLLETYAQCQIGDFQRLSNRAAAATESYQRALLTADEAIKRLPDDAALHAIRGQVEAALGNHEAALTDARDAIRLSPQEVDAYRGPAYRETLARIQVLLGDHADAIATLSDLLHTNYENPMTRELLTSDSTWDALRSSSQFRDLVNDK